MSHLADSNRGPSLYKSVALPTELRWLKALLSAYRARLPSIFFFCNISQV